MAAVGSLVLIPFLAVGGQVEIKWSCPGCEADGVVGFAVRYGRSTQLGVTSAVNGEAGPYEHMVQISDGSARSALMSVSEGNWYFSVTAVDGSGKESLLSSEVGIRVPLSPPSEVNGSVK